MSEGTSLNPNLEDVQVKHQDKVLQQVVDYLPHFYWKVNTQVINY